MLKLGKRERIGPGGILETEGVLKRRNVVNYGSVMSERLHNPQVTKYL